LNRYFYGLVVQQIMEVTAQTKILCATKMTEPMVDLGRIAARSQYGVVGESAQALRGRLWFNHPFCHERGGRVRANFNLERHIARWRKIRSKASNVLVAFTCRTRDELHYCKHELPSNTTLIKPGAPPTSRVMHRRHVLL